LEEIVQRIVNLLPAAFQYQEITCARIIMAGQEFRTENFKESTWKQARDIIVHNERIGTVEVYYMEEKPEIDEGPFLKEERALIAAIAERLGKIIEHKRAEEALRKSEEKYRTVLETSPDPVVVYDIEGKVIYFNPAFTRVFGWSFEERIEKKMDVFVPEKNWPETKMMIEKVLIGESFSGIESRRYTKEGKIIPVSISGAVYRDQEGNPVGSGLNLRDITEQKRAEDKIM